MNRIKFEVILLGLFFFLSGLFVKSSFTPLEDDLHILFRILSIMCIGVSLFFLYISGD